jgi:hypothetical protein
MFKRERASFALNLEQEQVLIFDVEQDQMVMISEMSEESND